MEGDISRKNAGKKFKRRLETPLQEYFTMYTVQKINFNFNLTLVVSN